MLDVVFQRNVCKNKTNHLLVINVNKLSLHCKAYCGLMASKRVKCLPEYIMHWKFEVTFLQQFLTIIRIY